MLCDSEVVRVTYVAFGELVMSVSEPFMMAGNREPVVEEVLT
jgi:hypothetical protein